MLAQKKSNTISQISKRRPSKLAEEDLFAVYNTPYVRYNTCIINWQDRNNPHGQFIDRLKKRKLKREEKNRTKIKLFDIRKKNRN